jgi:hypothetical protein
MQLRFSILRFKTFDDRADNQGYRYFTYPNRLHDHVCTPYRFYGYVIMPGMDVEQFVEIDTYIHPSKTCATDVAFELICDELARMRITVARMYVIKMEF